MSETKKYGNKVGTKAGRPKSEEKRESILLAASELFLSQGFSSTSMDLVANRAGVSKQTVYSHFSNKDALFVAVIGFKCRQYQLDEEYMAAADDDPRQFMIRFGNQTMSLLQDEQAIAMHRVVIGELTNNPHVAELFYAAGPQHGLQLLSQFMQSNASLRLSEQQAHYWSTAFFNLLKGDFHFRSLLGLPYSMSNEQQLAEVTRATDLILNMIKTDTLEQHLLP
ncbi:TetR/AcrR family transcriptional regulator [Aliiglaciecola sp. LCG003]|uniref:TetR/AcrR family transcriptional regulator n=1 Tax=Aliiglaciecola sp. LCG003 TaxID=3053655 RepID=UPI0025731663|nr:TetR/AcrR family transcriptional regulator [Aliiglaciecola sp. LCG003]WJG09989.1 TetR/AcrR family transcriptional regulator [Aliiglaciecola sp. LCG003]